MGRLFCAVWVVRDAASSTGFVKLVVVVGVALDGGVAALVLVCKGLGAALRWDLVQRKQVVSTGR